VNDTNRAILIASYEALVSATVDEANKPHPFWIRPESTISGVPRLAPEGGEFGGWNTLLLLSPRASGGLARVWKIVSDPSTEVVLPSSSRSGVRFRNVVPETAILLPVPPSRIRVDSKQVTIIYQQYEDFLQTRGISLRHLLALFRLFKALVQYQVFKGHWVGGWTNSSLQLTAGLAWSICQTSNAKINGTIPGWAFPEEQRFSTHPGTKGLASKPSGIWGWPSPRERNDALKLVRGARTAGPNDLCPSIAQAWDASLVLARMGGNPTGDPASDWRAVGRSIHSKLNALDFYAFDNLDDVSLLGLVWRRLVARHKHTSLPHLVGRLRYSDLVGDGRWDHSVLVPQLWNLRKRNPEHMSHSIGEIPLSEVGIDSLLSALRPRSLQVSETDLLANLERVIFGGEPKQRGLVSTDDRWSLILNALPNPRYQRWSKRKRNGGIRWLDVPSPLLKTILKLLERAIRPTFPVNRWACAFLPYRGPTWHAQMHSNSEVAVTVDIENFFGSVRPRHLEYWFGLDRSSSSKSQNILPDWSEAGRKAILDLVFASDNQRFHWLPQGASTSPWMANLAATRVDMLIHVGARRMFGNSVRYSRYADDLVLSVESGTSKIEPKSLVKFLERVLGRAGWTCNKSKTKLWYRTEKRPLIVCGVEIPQNANGNCKLTPSTKRRVRSALHHMRSLDYSEGTFLSNCAKDRGLLSFAYTATGNAALLAYTSRPLWNFVQMLAGPIFAEALLAGIADEVDNLK
jgi:hypothetical protein